MIKTDICKAPNCESVRDKKRRSSLCTMHRVRWGRYKSYDLPMKPGLPDGIIMKCIYHGELPIEETYKNTRYGYAQCLKCKKASNERFKILNPNRESNKNRNVYFLRRAPIKMKKEDYDKLLLSQNNVCAICLRAERMKKNNKKSDELRRLAIDHCHKTGKIRGLLCQDCNTSLGRLKDSIDILESAITYLKSHQ